MPLVVTFSKQGAAGDTAHLIMGRARETESVALDATSTASAQAGEFALIVNTETADVQVAHGSTPDATATAETDETTSYYLVPAGAYYPVKVLAGDKFAVVAVA